MTFCIADANAWPVSSCGSTDSGVGRLQDHLQVDGNRVRRGRDDVLLVHVDTDEDVEESQPCPGAPEEQPKILWLNTTRVLDEFCPAVAARASTRIARRSTGGAL